MASEAQRGQALVEALAGLAILGMLGTAVISVGRFQWHGLQASHVARVQVFRFALGDRTGLGEGASVSASAAALPVGPGLIRTSVMRARAAADFPGPGGAGAMALRRELGLEDRGMVRADAAVRVFPHRQHGHGWRLRRHAAILADAGHADSDARAQQRIGASRTAWGNAARASHAAAREAKSLLRRVDLGWRRPAPDLDWLMPWSSLVPADRLDREASAAGRRP
ncbi:hypothetical protein [Bordetella sp. H567]|uniref:hypothetical protein n=1 Tax=Bordetella sp. H567 TaxID=1697043 RepID=UPI00082EC18E|nr:hypothetical protein [Bordetella sp. H567]